MMAFRRAERKRIKFRIALDGPSGAGKTYSAIELAKGFVRGQATREDGSCRIGIINTEMEGAETYADHKDIGIPFDTLDLRPPFTAKKYTEAVLEGARLYDVLIIDSLSHAWSGQGGILEATDKAASAYSGNKFAAWAQTTPQHQAMVNAILQADCHIICTLRSKTAYDIQTDSKGKKVPVKIGLAPDQRAGIEYEFTAVLNISLDGHVATSSKDRTGLLDGTCQVLTPEIGVQLMDWMEKGVDAPPPPKSNGRGQVTELYEKAQLGGISLDCWKALVKEAHITKDKNTHTPAQVAHLRKRVNEEIEKLVRDDDVPMPDADPLPGSPEYVDRYAGEKQPEPEPPPRTFADDDMIDRLCRAAQASGLARTPKEFISFLRFHVKGLPEDFSDPKTLTVDECQEALAVVDKFGGDRARQHTMDHGDAWEGADDAQ